MVNADPMQDNLILSSLAKHLLRALNRRKHMHILRRRYDITYYGTSAFWCLVGKLAKASPFRSIS